MERRRFLKASGAIGGVGLTAGCLGDFGGSGEDPMVFGALEPLSGNFSAWGTAHRDGFEFARDEINDDGGVLGREVELTISDTASNADDADSLFQRFVEQDNAVAVAGPVSSTVGIRTAQTAQSLGVPLMLHMAGSDAVITENTTFTYRVGLLPATTTMQAQAQLVEAQGYQNVGAIIADYPWGQSVENGIENHFPVDVEIRTAGLSTSDFVPLLRQMSENLEMLVATGHPPGTFAIVEQAFNLGIEPEAITGPGFPPGVIRSALGENATRGFTHIHNTDVYSDEFADLASRYGQETEKLLDTHAAYGYVTGKLLAQAIEDAGSTDPEDINEAIKNISFDTVFAQPIEYTEYGEMKGQQQIYSQFSLEAPSYFDDASYSLTETFRTEPLPALAPGE